MIFYLHMKVAQYNFDDIKKNKRKLPFSNVVFYAQISDYAHILCDFLVQESQQVSSQE